MQCITVKQGFSYIACQGANCQDLFRKQCVSRTLMHPWFHFGFGLRLIWAGYTVGAPWKLIERLISILFAFNIMSFHVFLFNLPYYIWHIKLMLEWIEHHVWKQATMCACNLCSWIWMAWKRSFVFKFARECRFITRALGCDDWRQTWGKGTDERLMFYFVDFWVKFRPRMFLVWFSSASSAARIHHLTQGARGPSLYIDTGSLSAVGGKAV